MNDPARESLGENVGRMVRRWADPVTDDQVERSARAFIESLDRIPAPGGGGSASRRTRFWGATLVAASLLVSFTVLWAIFSSRDPRRDPEAPGPASTQEDLKKKLDRLVAKLGSEAPEERDGAMEEIRKTGADAVPHLKAALKSSQDAEVRSRIENLLAELDLPDPSVVFGGRLGGRADRLAAGGGNRATEASVLAALKWLARHQNPDGGWSAEGFGARCAGDKCEGAGEKDCDAGVTGLALLAFLGGGYSTLSVDEYPDPAKAGRTLKFGEVVKAGLKRLIAQQDREGCVGERGMKYMYNHAIATTALCEASGMTREAFVRAPAQKALDFLVASQNPGKGWRYSVKCGDNDSSVTGWGVMALKSAEFSSLKVPRKAYDGALAWLDEATQRDGYYQTGYTMAGTGKVFVPGQNEMFDHHATMSAISVTSRLFIRKTKTEPALGAVNLLVADRPEWKANRIDFYYWYHASLALFQYDGPEGPMWKRWNEPLKAAIVPNQKTGKEGCQDGSWDPKADRWGGEGGRVYATAINALTLQVYYRYPVVCEKK